VHGQQHLHAVPQLLAARRYRQLAATGSSPLPAAAATAAAARSVL